jgi:DNA polymerase (family 10)
VDVSLENALTRAAAAIEPPPTDDGRLARAAREAGLKLIVSTDAHEVGALEFTRFGVGQARRAWCTRDDIVNTRSWKQVEKIRRKRP